MSDYSSDSDVSAPFYAGLVLNSNYIVIKTIGSGSDNVVWLVYSIEKNDFYAMKVNNDLDGLYECALKELSILKTIKKNNPPKNVLTITDHFVYIDGNKFVCMIFELWDCSLDDVITNGIYKYGMPLDYIKKITKSVLQGLEFIHNKMDIIHTDLKAANILLKSENKNSELMEEIKENFSERIKNLLEKRANGMSTKKFNNAIQKIADEIVESLEEDDNDSDATSEDEDESEDESEDDVEYDNDDDTSESYDSDDDDEEGERLRQLINKNRRQSVDDYLEDLLPVTRDTDLDESYMSSPHGLLTIADSHYFNDIVLNKRVTGETTDKRVIIKEKYIKNPVLAITDFGQACYSSDKTKDEISPRSIRSPEIILDHFYDKGVDIWAIGCLVFMMATGYDVADPTSDELCNTDIHHLFLIEKYLEPVPNNMIKKSVRGDVLYDPRRGYHLRNVAEFERVSMFDRLKKQHLIDWSDKDITDISEFLRFILRVDPAKRPSVSEVLEHPFLN